MRGMYITRLSLPFWAMMSAAALADLYFLWRQNALCSCCGAAALLLTDCWTSIITSGFHQMYRTLSGRIVRVIRKAHQCKLASVLSLARSMALLWRLNGIQNDHPTISKYLHMSGPSLVVCCPNTVQTTCSRL